MKARLTIHYKDRYQKSKVYEIAEALERADLASLEKGFASYVIEPEG